MVSYDGLYGDCRIKAVIYAIFTPFGTLFGTLLA